MSSRLKWRDLKIRFLGYALNDNKIKKLFVNYEEFYFLSLAIGPLSKIAPSVAGNTILGIHHSASYW